MRGNIAQEILPGTGQIYGIITMATGGKTAQSFTEYMNQAVGTVGTGYLNAKWNERPDEANLRTFYTA